MFSIIIVTTVVIIVVIVVIIFSANVDPLLSEGLNMKPPSLSVLVLVVPNWWCQLTFDGIHLFPCPPLFLLPCVCRVSSVASCYKWLVRKRHEKVHPEFVRNRVYNWQYSEIVTQCQYIG